MSFLLRVFYPLLHVPVSFLLNSLTVSFGVSFFFVILSTSCAWPNCVLSTGKNVQNANIAITEELNGDGEEIDDDDEEEEEEM